VDLEAVRRKIDEVDLAIVELLGKRATLAAQAGIAKAAVNAPVVDPSREAIVLDSRRRWANELGFDADGVVDVFRAIVVMARRVQAR
jgi:chorismate mutase